jgi:hypothetical protein
VTGVYASWENLEEISNNTFFYPLVEKKQLLLRQK